MLKVLSYTCAICGFFIFSIANTAFANSDGSDSDGRVVKFNIEDRGTVHSQVALVQNQKVFIQRAGGDANLDLLFEANTHTLFVINHQVRGYYKIDQNVVNKAASMIKSLSNVAESQQGVLSDLLNTFGLAVNEQADVNIVVKETDKTLVAADVPCKLIQQYRNNKLQSELCVAAEQSLSKLGNHYDTFNEFYKFGDQMIKQAGNILSNMGMVVPNFAQLSDNGLPIMAYMAAEKIKIVLDEILDQTSDDKHFQIPQGYVQTPIPFIG